MAEIHLLCEDRKKTTLMALATEPGSQGADNATPPPPRRTPNKKKKITDLFVFDYSPGVGLV